jgi:bifunctional non-homologous end joining protein LigD
MIIFPGLTLEKMPLDWAQVKKGLDPTRFNICSVPALLSKSAAWNDYCSEERPLVDALRKVVALEPLRRAGEGHYEKTQGKT